ncbi:MAG TPA: NADH-quinone oxidoreductase subunit NuoH [Gemmatimonadales bacterium]|nr:NADH-quinone oxidoreductase subunit NuoH [Gemmatimonadales bacterium]
MTPELKGFLLVAVIKLLVVFTVTMLGVAYMTFMERKVSAWMQNRLGPNRVGPGGWLQPIADGIKNILKEETLPRTANLALFFLAPCMSFIPALCVGAVIPWAAPLPVAFDFTLPLLGRFTHAGLVSMAVADVPVGFLFVLAISSLGVYGIAIAGWSSNSKYALLGGLRAAAQMISYEVAMGMSLVPLLLLTGNVSFSSIIGAQQQGLWFALPLMVSAFVFLVAGFAETNRAPFDLPEAESELVAGYHTEYSAFKFSMFFIAEYANVLTFSAMFTSLFLGGWDIPFIHWDETPGLLQTLATGAFMAVKVTCLVFFVMWIRWTLPRFRYDQLMALGWKFMLPLALVNIMGVAIASWVARDVLGLVSPLAQAALLTALSLAVTVLLFMVVDRGFLISGVGSLDFMASRRARPVRPMAIPREAA